MLVDIGLDNLSRETRGEGPFSPVLPQHGHDDFRIATRSDSYEPGVGEHLVSSAEAADRFVAGYLGCTGLAGEVDALEMRGSGGAAGLRDQCHTIGDGFPVLWMDRNGLIAGAGE